MSVEPEHLPLYAEDEVPSPEAMASNDTDDHEGDVAPEQPSEGDEPQDNPEGAADDGDGGEPQPQGKPEGEPADNRYDELSRGLMASNQRFGQFQTEITSTLDELREGLASMRSNAGPNPTKGEAAQIEQQEQDIAEVTEALDSIREMDARDIVEAGTLAKVMEAVVKHLRPAPSDNGLRDELNAIKEQYKALEKQLGETRQATQSATAQASERAFHEQFAADQPDLMKVEPEAGKMVLDAYREMIADVAEDKRADPQTQQRYYDIALRTVSAEVAARGKASAKPEAKANGNTRRKSDTAQGSQVVQRGSAAPAREAATHRSPLGIQLYEPD